MNKIDKHQNHDHAKSTLKKVTKKAEKKKLPATVLCGFLGSGKTTLLNEILNNQEGYKVAVIVNDMSELNIDAMNVKGGQAVFKRTEEKLVELSNGCICCTLRDDLVKEISKLAKKTKFDYLLIEATGMAEPLPIAQAFSFEDEHGKSLYDIAQIDTMVTVVDAINFHKQISSIETVKEEVKQGEGDEEEEIPVAQLFIDQIEFANVIIINKVDLVTKEQIESVESLIKKLNPGAEVIHASFSKVPLDKVLFTKKFDFEEAQNTTKWIEELSKVHSPETEEYGFSSFVFQSKRPFNPEKLWALMEDEEAFRNVVRAKGFVWIATNSKICGALNIVGDIKTLEADTVWWSAIKKHKWGDTKEEIELVEKHVKGKWDAVYGDRRQELVFIGQSMKKDEILAKLNDALISEDEYEKGFFEWKKMFKDPFTRWAQATKTHPMRANFKTDKQEFGGENEVDVEKRKKRFGTRLVPYKTKVMRLRKRTF